MTNQESQDMFRGAIPGGFAWELLELISGEYKCAASWENQQCGFRTGLTQTGLYKHRKDLEA